MSHLSQEPDSCFTENADLNGRHSIPVSGSRVGTGKSGGGECHKFTLRFTSAKPPQHDLTLFVLTLFHYIFSNNSTAAINSWSILGTSRNLSYDFYSLKFLMPCRQSESIKQLSLGVFSSPRLTIHLSFIWKDDLSAATGWINGQSLLKTLFDVRAPDALRIPVHSGLVHPIHSILLPLLRALVGAPLVGCNGGGSTWAPTWALTPRTRREIDVVKTGGHNKRNSSPKMLNSVI